MVCILIVNFLTLYRLNSIFQNTLLNNPESSDNQPDSPRSFKVNRLTIRSSSGLEILERNPTDVFNEREKTSIKKIYFLLCLPTGRFIYEQWIRLIQMRSHPVNKGQKSQFDSCTKILILKWGVSSRWSSSLYYPMLNSNQMTIGKKHPTLARFRTLSFTITI